MKILNIFEIFAEYLMYFFHFEETRPLVSILTYIDRSASSSADEKKIC
jgi:hypothetical protein